MMPKLHQNRVQPAEDRVVDAAPGQRGDDFRHDPGQQHDPGQDAAEGQTAVEQQRDPHADDEFDGDRGRP